MRPSDKKITFEVTLENSEKVDVTYYPDFINHLEFRGNISETGYRSEFPFPHDDHPSLYQVKELAQILAQKLYDMNPAKFGKQKSLM